MQSDKELSCLVCVLQLLLHFEKSLKAAFLKLLEIMHQILLIQDLRGRRSEYYIAYILKFNHAKKA